MFLLDLTKSVMVLALYTLNNANVMASKIEDFPAPFSPTIRLIPGLKSNVVLACDLKFFNSNFLNIIISPN